MINEEERNQYGKKEIEELYLHLQKNLSRIFVSIPEFEEVLEEWKVRKNFVYVNCKGLRNPTIYSRWNCFGIIKIMVYIIEYYQTLPIGTLSIEKGFSEMNQIKIDLRNRIKEDLLSCLLGIRLNGSPWTRIDDDLISRAILICRE